MTQQYLEFACNLARQAGVMICEGFDKNLAVESKADDSPVTVVDKGINQLVIDSIKKTYPSHGLLGEEADYGTGKEQYRWICDPLDGTKAFILGVPNSVFMLSLMKDSDLLVAVIYDPFTDRLYYATKGGGAFCNGRAIHVSNQPLRKGYFLVGATSHAFVDAIKAAGGRIEAVSGGGYKYMMIADGRAVGTIKDGADFHDVAAGALIIKEAGGQVTALDGSKLILDKKIAGTIMSNRAAHADMLSIARSILM